MTRTTLAWQPPELLVALARPGDPPIDALDDEPFDELVATCEYHRMLGVLADAIRGGRLGVSPRQLESFEELYRNWLAHDLQLEKLLCQVADRLDADGIDFRVLKGIALANGIYEDPAQRVFGDADVLVRSRDFTRAAGVIAAMGGTRALPELRPGFDDRFGREILLRFGPLELDLHRTLLDGALGLAIETDDLFERPAPILIGGRAMSAMSPEAQLTHACYATVLGDWPPRLSARCDVARILADLDEAAGVVALADRWQASAVVAQGILETVQSLGVTIEHPLVSWAQAFRPTPREQSLIRAARGPGRGYSRHLASLSTIHGFANRIFYLRSIVLPSRKYLDARGLDRSKMLKRTLAAIRRK
jgi:Uncharacterised nucleotidyltransferase